MKKFIIAASLVATAAVAVPALAVQQGGPDGGRQTATRAQVQAKVQERFTAMDTNRDGAVTKVEYDANRAKMQADREAKRTERRTEMFAKLDADKDGQISKTEFAARPDRGDRRGGPDGKRGGPDGPGGERGGKHMRGHGGPGGGHGMGGWGGWGGPKGDDRAAAFYASMDANKDGKVTLAEASATPLAMFDKADANKDGTVTPEERRAAWTAKRAAR